MSPNKPTGNTTWSRGGLKLVCLTMLALLFTGSVWSQDAVEYFESSCASCHTIGGGKLTGPDLKNVHERQDKEWLIKFILDPQAVIDSGDPYASQLVMESNGVIMRKTAGINRGLAEKLLAMIEEESAKEKSKFAGVQLSERALTAEDIRRGRAIFHGTRTLANGGPSCISCHSVAGVKGWGGGTLGPDLTTVFSRLEGRKGLGAWLSAPATPTMQQVYKDHELESEEVMHLLAYFKEEGKSGKASSDLFGARINFFLTGILGAVLAVLLMDFLWRKRFRAVRRPMVRGDQ